MLIDGSNDGMPDTPPADDMSENSSPLPPAGAPTPADRKLVVALVADLIYASKISGTARAAGVPAECRRSWESTAACLGNAAALIVDLQLGDDALAAIREARAQQPALHILAFGAHVEKELLAAASAAGATAAMPRSKFSARLADILVHLSQQMPI